MFSKFTVNLNDNDNYEYQERWPAFCYFEWPPGLHHTGFDESPLELPTVAGGLSYN